MTDALTTPEAARDALGMDEDELAAAIEDGTLRRVRHGDGAFILSEDVRRLARANDPKYLARLVGRGGGDGAADPDDDDNPRNLAADIPRL